jgi:uncharacterized protein (DUF1499 family)
MTGNRARLTGLVVAAVLLAGCSADTRIIDFASLTRSNSPNDALACPANVCTAKTDFVTQPVALSVVELAAKIAQVLPAEPRTELISRSDAAADGSVSFVLVQRTAVFHFPDTVNVLVRPVDEQHATVAVYSRSNYGYGDFGVNLARVKDWLGKLGVDSIASP